MQQFVANLFSKIGFFLFFIVLEGLALFFMYKQSDFHKNAIGVRATALNGLYSERVAAVKHYVNLPEENNRLLIENAKLKNELQKQQPAEIIDTVKSIQKIDSIHRQKYTYLPAKLSDISLRKRDNYFLINRGTSDGVKPDMSVITPNGIVGVILNASENYAYGISILHSKTRVKARVKGMGDFGILVWPGKDHRYLSLKEIPKYIPVKQGDTIETAGASALYPQGVEVGYIKSMEPDSLSGDYNIQVELFDDLGEIRNVYVVENLDQIEIKKLQNLETNSDASVSTQ